MECHHNSYYPSFELEESPVGVCITADVKNPLTEDTLIKGMFRA